MNELRLLLTGFEPFGEHPSNPTLTALSAFEGRKIGQASVHTAPLPVDTEALPGALDEAIRRV